jgi:hypothetical protein
MRFPGAMPVNLCRKDIPVVQRENFFLSEKTDGVRQVLVVLRRC